MIDNLNQQEINYLFEQLNFNQNIDMNSVIKKAKKMFKQEANVERSNTREEMLELIYSLCKK
jgi:hypothetical protein